MSANKPLRSSSLGFPLAEDSILRKTFAKTSFKLSKLFVSTLFKTFANNSEGLIQNPFASIDSISILLGTSESFKLA
jgi:hypothetical protein